MERSRTRKAPSAAVERLARAGPRELTRPHLPSVPTTGQPPAPHVHRPWKVPVEAVLVAVLTVPGPSTLTNIEVKARQMSPTPRLATMLLAPRRRTITSPL